MTRHVFINLPVLDLARSRAFWEALGFSFKDELSNDKAICLNLSDDVQVMLIQRDFFQTWTPKPVADATFATQGANSPINRATTCIRCREEPRKKRGERTNMSTSKPVPTNSSTYEYAACAHNAMPGLDCQTSSQPRIWIIPVSAHTSRCQGLVQTRSSMITGSIASITW